MNNMYGIIIMGVKIHYKFSFSSEFIGRLRKTDYMSPALNRLGSSEPSRNLRVLFGVTTALRAQSPEIIAINGPSPFWPQGQVDRSISNRK